MKIFLKILIIQIITIPFIIILFKTIDSNKHAGLIAGLCFFTTGLYFLSELKRSTKMFRTFSFYGISFHLLVAVIPMLIIRIMHWSLNFKDINILTLPASEFHKISESIYMIMLLCTILDFFRVIFLKIPIGNEVN